MNLAIRLKLITVLDPCLVSRQIGGPGEIIRNARVSAENKHMSNTRISPSHLFDSLLAPLWCQRTCQVMPWPI